MKTEARKEFSYGFVLTEQELRRIVDVAVQQLEKVTADDGPPVKPQIQVKYINGTLTETDTLDDLLSMENVGSRRITRIRVGFFEMGKKFDDFDTEYQDDVHFIGLTFNDPEVTGASSQSISYVVKGSNRDWVFVTASELDERIAKVKRRTVRALLTDTPRFFFPALAFLGVLCGFAFMLTNSVSHLSSQPTAQTLEAKWKAGTLRDPIEAMIIEEKDREIDRKSLDPANIVNRATLIPISILLSVGLVALLFVYLSPGYIFCWGDYKKIYETRLKVRRYVFSVVIVGLVVGIIASVIANKITSLK